MLLADTNDKLQLVTSTAATIDVVVTFFDASTDNPPVVQGDTSAKQLTTISSATTTDILAAPGASTIRNVKQINIRNKHASLSSDVTVVFDDNGTDYELVKVTLKPGDTLTWSDYLGTWYVVAGTTTSYINESTGSQGAGFSSDTYLTGSNIAIPSGLPVVGTAYRLTFEMTKTAAGTQTPIITIRYGTNGTTGDTGRGTLTFGAGTAAADTGLFVVESVFRTVGSGTSAVLASHAGVMRGTGIVGSTNVGGAQAVSGGFDSTVANSIIGASFNGGTSFSGTAQLVRAELIP